MVSRKGKRKGERGKKEGERKRKREKGDLNMFFFFKGMEMQQIYNYLHTGE